MTLTRVELFHSNMALTRQHLLDLIAHPDRFDWIPNGAHVIGLPKNDRKLFEANMKLAHRIALKSDGNPIILLTETFKRRTVRRKSRTKTM